MTDPQPSDSRLARRRAERRAERRARRRFVRVALFGVTVVGLVTALVLLLVDGTGTGAAPAGGTAQPAGSTTDAELGDADLANAYIAAATSDLTAVTSYDYRHLDDALSAGLGVTTGDYRRAYQAALTGDLAATARRNHTVQNFDLLRAGIGYLAADGSSGVVLAFGTETVIEDDRTTTSPLTLTATLERQGSTFLISKLEVGTNPGLPPGTQAMLTAAEAGRERVLAQLAAEPGVQASVSAIAVERAGGDTVVLLVAGTGSKPDSSGKPLVVIDGRYEVTVVRTNGRWTATDVAPVGSA
ncbi:MAG TPA: hypothetical protein VGN18_02260 [Jatrophihabitans sp.]|uniref:hypothetical protein n=1 Tax=Jatrophihabitans sp. TaxID=1932789 RepID=UPI002E05944C|nr:hypothetical protein [Jatrophihabitans sp.]